MTKENEIMQFLDEKVFNPILNSSDAPVQLKSGARITRARMEKLDAKGMVKYYWSAIVGTERSIKFAANLKNSGFIRFEEVIDEFRIKFGDDFLIRNN